MGDGLFETSRSTGNFFEKSRNTKCATRAGKRNLKISTGADSLLWKSTPQKRRKNGSCYQPKKKQKFRPKLLDKLIMADAQYND